MIELAMLLTRRADLTHEEFVSYWTETHTRKISGMPNTAAVAKRYVQLLPTGESLVLEAKAVHFFRGATPGNFVNEYLPKVVEHLYPQATTGMSS